MNPRAATSFLLLALALPPAVALAQQALPTRTVLATVADTGNRTLDDLEVDDFAVDERGEPRQVLSVHLADYPLALLVDDSAEASNELPAIRTAVARFIARLGQRPIAIVGLGAPQRLAVSFDDDRAAALAAVDGLQPSAGPPAPLEAANLAAKAIAETGALFSGIVVVSAQSVEATTATRGELLKPILDSGAAVHVVGRRMAGEPVSGQNDLLRALADQTGGQFTTIYSTASYAVALDRLAVRLATEMMIEYVLPPGTTPGGDVRVGVRIPGAKVTGLGVR